MILAQLVEKALCFRISVFSRATKRRGRGNCLTNKRADDTRPKQAKIIVLTRFRGKKNSMKIGLVLREQCQVLLVEK